MDTLFIIGMTIATIGFANALRLFAEDRCYKVYQKKHHTN